MSALLAASGDTCHGRYISAEPSPRDRWIQVTMTFLSRSCESGRELFYSRFCDVRDDNDNDDDDDDVPGLFVETVASRGQYPLTVSLQICILLREIIPAFYNTCHFDGISEEILSSVFAKFAGKSPK